MYLITANLTPVCVMKKEQTWQINEWLEENRSEELAEPEWNPFHNLKAQEQRRATDKHAHSLRDLKRGDDVKGHVNL